MSETERQRTPTLVETIQALFEGRLSELNTSIPGKIVSYDYEKNLAVVQPVLKRKYVGETEAVELPTISNVSVCFPRMGLGHLRIPVNVGDEGQITFQQRSIDKWSISGGMVDPEDARKFSISDATFWPGLNPNNKAIKSTAAEKSLELKLKGSYIEILDNGKFKVKGNSEELFDLLVKTIDKMITLSNELGTKDKTNTIFGPMQPNNFMAYQDLEVAFTELKTKMETLKG